MASSLLGGVLIGLSASIAHAGARQVAGVSGHLGALLRAPRRAVFGTWFVLGLLLGAALIAGLGLAPSSVLPLRSPFLLAVSGMLVGFGTRLGSGCTSGHGVCGVSRLSPRSLVATGVFMATAAVTVLVTRHVLAGTP